jgi:UDP-N-acetylglucosamine/UDP-N-acetylgalactosamine diphosphorylase
MIIHYLDGNGGIYEVIGDLLPKLEKQGVKYFHTYCVDNILCRVGDPVFIGHSIKMNADCSAKVSGI